MDNSQITVLSLCDFSGIAVKPWAAAGFNCLCVDTKHSIRRDRIDGRITYTWGDVRSWCPPEYMRNHIGILFAFPPCTHVAVSGARDFRKKRNILLRDSLELFSSCEMVATYTGAPYMIENPVGKFSDHMGKPNYVFQPWHYGDMYSKCTCLWTGNGFIMPRRIIQRKPAGIKSIMWEMAPSDDRADIRSITPEHFAAAVYKANVAMVLKKVTERS